MAAAAVVTELTVVDVVVSMAVAALFGNHVGHGKRRAMAALAVHLGVRAVEPEFGLCIVIEFPQPPAIGVVTPTATLAEAALVMIVVGMTFQAVGRCLREVRAEVTGLAWGNRMQTDQGKAAEIVIETQLRPPAGLVVAIRA